MLFTINMFCYQFYPDHNTIQRDKCEINENIIKDCSFFNVIYYKNLVSVKKGWNSCERTHSEMFPKNCPKLA